MNMLKDEARAFWEVTLVETNSLDSVSSVSSIPFAEDFLLGPLDKYTKYGYFPYKFVVHIIMLGLTLF